MWSSKLPSPSGVARSFARYIAGWQLTTGVNQTAGPDGITVFPNPNNGDFTISLPETRNTHLKVMNVLGEIVYDRMLSDIHNTISLPNKPTGIYFIELENGSGIMRKKMLIN